MRIVNAMARRALTTGELCERLRDVSQASVYRHVALLVRGGILVVAGEEPRGGAVQRRYELCKERAAVAPAEGRTMSRTEHQRAFGGAMAALIAEFNAYIGRRSSRPFDDQVSYRQGVVWLAPHERAALVAEVRAVLAARVTSPPGGDRRAYLLSTIFFPVEDFASVPGASKP